MHLFKRAAISVEVYLWVDLIKLLLENGSYLPEKVEECHFKNGLMQSWELDRFRSRTAHVYN